MAQIQGAEVDEEGFLVDLSQWMLTLVLVGQAEHTYAKMQ